MTLFGYGEREAAARSMAGHASAMISRKASEPVDVCRWHRDLSDDALDAAVAALNTDQLVERASVALQQADGLIPGYVPDAAADDLARAVLVAIGLIPKATV